MEITVEMGCFKFPYNSMIPKLWDQHKYSLLSFMQAVHTGVKGVVHDRHNNSIPNASVAIISGGQGKNITTTLVGEYWRILSPGNYTVRFVN